MRLRLPPSSIPCGLVRLNYLAWGLTLRRLIRKLCPWCSRILIAAQPNIMYAPPTHPHIPPYPPICPNGITPCMVDANWLHIKSKPQNSNSSTISISIHWRTIILRPPCLILVCWGRWEQCDPYLTLCSVQFAFKLFTLITQSDTVYYGWYGNVHTK